MPSLVCISYPPLALSFQWKKAEEKLERELREAEASESTEKKLKLVGTSTLSHSQDVLLSYFNYKWFQLKVNIILVYFMGLR